MSTEADPILPPSSPARYGLRFKILAALTLFNVVAITLFTIDRTTSERNRIMEGIEKRLEVSARALPDMLPEGYLDRASGEGAISEGEYRTLVDKLTLFCNGTGLRYLYTYARQGDAFRCSSSNGTAEEMAKDSYTRYWARYDTAPKAIFRAWDSGKPVYTEVSDQWGRTYTLFLPLSTKQGTRFIAGADLPIDFVSGVLAESLKRTLLIGLASFAVFFVISYWASTRFSRHITLLDTYTHELAEKNFSPEPESVLGLQIRRLPEKRTDEVGRLAASFLLMEERLQTYIRELTEATATRERIQNELRIAGDIQASMLPQDIGSIVGKRLDVAASMKPAKEAGGDLYDLFLLDEDHLLFVIADVSDKGMPAALFMAATVTTLRARATVQMMAAPERLVGEINELLLKQNPMCQFVTLFLGVLRLSTGDLVYSNGGHNSPYLLRTTRRVEMLAPCPGCALGVMPGVLFARAKLRLEPGETLLLYTDGVTEAMAADESFYGEPRLEAVLASLPEDSTAGETINRIAADVAAFSQGHAQADDITMLALRRP